MIIGLTDFAQILGYVSFILAIIAFSQKSDLRFKIILSCAQLILVPHFFLLGASSAAILKIVSTLRDASSIFSFRKKLFAPFLIVYIALLPLMLETWVSLLTYIGVIVALVALYLFHGLVMRLFLLLSTSLWLVHNIVVGSQGGVLMEVFILCANLVTIYRLSRDKKSSI